MLSIVGQEIISFVFIAYAIVDVENKDNWKWFWNYSMQILEIMSEMDGNLSQICKRYEEMLDFLSHVRINLIVSNKIQGPSDIIQSKHIPMSQILFPNFVGMDRSL